VGEFDLEDWSGAAAGAELESDSSRDTAAGVTLQPQDAAAGPARLGLETLRLRLQLRRRRSGQAGRLRIVADDEDTVSSSPSSSSPSSSPSSSSSFSSSSSGGSSSSSHYDGPAASSAVPLTLKAAANGSVTVARKAAEKLEYPDLHNLSAEDLHSIAAIVATVLLVQRVQGEVKSADTRKTVSSDCTDVSAFCCGMPVSATF
jgi:hypothetical protein